MNACAGGEKTCPRPATGGPDRQPPGLRVAGEAGGGDAAHSHQTPPHLAPPTQAPEDQPPPREAASPACEAIIAEVARRMGVPEEQLRGRNRSQQVAAARHAAFWALHRAGLSPTRIARLLGLNHSSVVHGLARAERHPEWRALVAPAVALAGAGGQRPALRSWLARGLRGQPADVHAAVRAYVTCTLLGRERHPGPRCAYGLWLVAARPQLRAAVAEALERCDLAAFLGLIPAQEGRAGYALADARTGARSRELP